MSHGLRCSPEKAAKSAEKYREIFAEEVIGRFDDALLPRNVRSRLVYDEPKFRGYEVVMDVFPDVIAYGILLVPKGINAGERRPVLAGHRKMGRSLTVLGQALTTGPKRRI